MCVRTPHELGVSAEWCGTHPATRELTAICQTRYPRAFWSTVLWGAECCLLLWWTVLITMKHLLLRSCDLTKIFSPNCRALKAIFTKPKNILSRISCYRSADSWMHIKKTNFKAEFCLQVYVVLSRWKVTAQNNLPICVMLIVYGIPTKTFSILLYLLILGARLYVRLWTYLSYALYRKSPSHQVQYLWCEINSVPSSRTQEEIMMGTITYSPASVCRLSMSSERDTSQAISHLRRLFCQIIYITHILISPEVCIASKHTETYKWRH